MQHSEINRYYNDLKYRIKDEKIRSRLMKILAYVLRRIAYDIKYNNILSKDSIRKYVYTAYADFRIFEIGVEPQSIEESAKAIVNITYTAIEKNYKKLSFIEKALMHIIICSNAQEKRLSGFCELR